MRTPFKMKGFSGFGNSPMKQTKEKKVKKQKSLMDRMSGSSTWAAPVYEFMARGAKGLESTAYRGLARGAAAWGIFKGYGKLAKTKYGKEIIKQSGVGRTRKI